MALIYEVYIILTRKGMDTYKPIRRRDTCLQRTVGTTLYIDDGDQQDLMHE